MLAFLIWLLMYVVPVFFTDCFVCLDEEGGGTVVLLCCITFCLYEKCYTNNVWLIDFSAVKT